MSICLQLMFKKLKESKIKLKKSKNKKDKEINKNKMKKNQNETNTGRHHNFFVIHKIKIFENNA